MADQLLDFYHEQAPLVRPQRSLTQVLLQGAWRYALHIVESKHCRDIEGFFSEKMPLKAPAGSMSGIARFSTCKAGTSDSHLSLSPHAQRFTIWVFSMLLGKKILSNPGS